FEEVDPNDKGSYANASLTARISTVVAGSLANYLFASVLFFGAFMLGGQYVSTSEVRGMPGGAAAEAQRQDNDEVIRIGDQPIQNFEEMRDIILASPGRELPVVVRRDGQEVTLKVTPKPLGSGGGGLIGVAPVNTRRVPVSLEKATVMSV